MTCESAPIRQPPPPNRRELRDRATQLTPGRGVWARNSRRVSRGRRRGSPAAWSRPARGRGRRRSGRRGRRARARPPPAGAADRDGDAAHAGLLLLLVGRPPLVGDAVQLGDERVEVGDGRRGARRQAGTPQHRDARARAASRRAAPCRRRWSAAARAGRPRRTSAGCAARAPGRRRRRRRPRAPRGWRSPPTAATSSARWGRALRASARWAASAEPHRGGAEGVLPGRVTADVARAAAGSAAAGARCPAAGR